MTNANSNEPLAPAPPSGYWTLHLDSIAQRAKARARGEERAVDEFILKVNKASDLIARKNPNPAMRAEGYRNKPAELWAEQFIYFPYDVEEDWRDWERIAPQDQNLRDLRVAEIEELLGLAGVDLRDEDIHSAAAKMERYLAAPASEPSRPAMPAAPNASARGGSGELAPGDGGAAYP